MTAPTPLSPERLAEYVALVQAATPGPWRREDDAASLTRFVVSDDSTLVVSLGYVGNRTQRDAEFIAAARTAVPELLAEVGRVNALLEFEQEDGASLRAKVEHRNATIESLRADLAKYVGKEPTIAEEMQHLTACLMAVYDLADKAKRDGCLGITSEAVEQAAGGDWPRDPKDNRRSLYVDGEGNAWIDQSQDPDGTQYVVPVDSLSVGDKPLGDVRTETGSLREIGRCW